VIRRVLDVEFPGQPLPKKRPRFTAGNRAYTDVKTLRAEEAIRWQLSRVRPVEGDLSVDLTFWRKDKRRVDIDNLIKLCLDAANGVVWKDDSQIVRLTGLLVRGPNKDPRTRMVVDLLADLEDE
jgi:Holliday junction resolvase RusA-like endonuclease